MPADAEKVGRRSRWCYGGSGGGWRGCESSKRGESDEDWTADVSAGKIEVADRHRFEVMVAEKEEEKEEEEEERGKGERGGRGGEED